MSRLGLILNVPLAFLAVLSSNSATIDKKSQFQLVALPCFSDLFTFC
jgi:hypothetical protein